jgi:hypothetical protein
VGVIVPTAGTGGLLLNVSVAVVCCACEIREVKIKIPNKSFDIDGGYKKLNGKYIKPDVKTTGFCLLPACNVNLKFLM